MVVAYKQWAGCTFFLSKFLMTVTHITLINILHKREAVPEFLQQDAGAGSTGEVRSPICCAIPGARAPDAGRMNEFAQMLGEGESRPPSAPHGCCWTSSKSAQLRSACPSWGYELRSVGPV